MPASTPFIQPDWHLPLTGEPVRKPLVCRSTGVVAAAGSKGAPAQDSVERLPGTVVLPAFVNAHTHLDLSSFENPLGHSGIRLTDWLVQIIRFRTAATSQINGAPSEIVRRAIANSKRLGTSTIGNIAGMPWQPADPNDSLPIIVDYFEQLGADPNQAVDRNRSLVAFVNQFDRRPGEKRATGISPHAPYSISMELFDLTIDQARSRKLPVAMHLAESVEERTFLENKTGPFLDMFGALGLDPGKADFPPIHYCLQRLAECESALVVHGNYLNDSEMDLIAQHSSRISVVWCPRTHQWFGHSPWPLKKMLQRGICVAIGTDSLASSPDLDVLAELQAIAKSMPELDPRTILRLGTLNGYQAIVQRVFAESTDPIPQVILRYAEEIPDDPESAVLSMKPVQRTLLDPSETHSRFMD